MDKKRLLESVSKSKADITNAERELERVVREMSPTLEKMTVSKVVGDAFDKLREAKANLIELERVLLEDV